MDNTPDTTFEVEVAYATPVRQEVIPVSISAGCTAQHAAQLSGIGKIFSDIDWTNIRLGIFGQRVSADHLLTAGDRVEIYRPLLIDPKESRRQRAHLAKQQRSQKISGA